MYTCRAPERHGNKLLSFLSERSSADGRADGRANGPVDKREDHPLESQTDGHSVQVEGDFRPAGLTRDVNGPQRDIVHRLPEASRVCRRMGEGKGLLRVFCAADARPRGFPRPRPPRICAATKGEKGS